MPEKKVQLQVQWPNIPGIVEDLAVKAKKAESEKKMDYKEMWFEQKEWLKRVSASGQRTKSVAALMNMEDIEKRRLSGGVK
jgi:hypothetical protein